MRTAWALLLAGCYSAAPPQGIACDPSSPACPRGQACVQGPAGFICSTGPGEEPDAPKTGEPDAAIDAPPDPMTITKTYNATVAECLAPVVLPSAMYCRSINGNTQLVVDAKDAMTNDAWNGYVRFDLDNALAGKTITKVTLRVMATSDGKAPGPDTGSIYRTGSFTKMSLEGTAPAIQGNAIAGSQGPVQQNTAVSWNLPVSTVTVNGSVYLAIIPNNDDGVNYYNTDGATPPRLIVEAQ